MTVLKKLIIVSDNNVCISVVTVSKVRIFLHYTFHFHTKNYVTPISPKKHAFHFKRREILGGVWCVWTVFLGHTH